MLRPPLGGLRFTRGYIPRSCPGPKAKAQTNDTSCCASTAVRKKPFVEFELWACKRSASICQNERRLAAAAGFERAPMKSCEWYRTGDCNRAESRSLGQSHVPAHLLLGDAFGLANRRTKPFIVARVAAWQTAANSRKSRSMSASAVFWGVFESSGIAADRNVCPTAASKSLVRSTCRRSPPRQLGGKGSTGFASWSPNRFHPPVCLIVGYCGKKPTWRKLLLGHQRIKKIANFSLGNLRVLW